TAAAAAAAAATATSTAAVTVATEVDGCAQAANDISLVEMLHGPKKKGEGFSGNGGHQARRRRSGSGKCIWPTTEWLRKLRNQKTRETDLNSTDQDVELGRRSSVLLMVLLSTSDEVKAKTILVSGQQPAQSEVKLDEDVEDAIDALWL
ncbi:hypothetical protein KR074_012014, partial [Drosophila pseudoananassae]